MPLTNETRVRVDGRSKIEGDHAAGEQRAATRTRAAALQARRPVEDRRDGLGRVVAQRQERAPGQGRVRG